MLIKILPLVAKNDDFWSKRATEMVQIWKLGVIGPLVPKITTFAPQEGVEYQTFGYLFWIIYILQNGA